jgi:hypothetical protein
MKEYKYVVTRTTYETEVVIVKADSEYDADNMVQEMIDTDAINFDDYTNSDVDFNYDIIDIKEVE